MQTITDAALDVVAKAIYEAEYDRNSYPWSNVDDDEKLSYKTMARAAMLAMRELED